MFLKGAVILLIKRPKTEDFGSWRGCLRTHTKILLRQRRWNFFKCFHVFEYQLLRVIMRLFLLSVFNRVILARLNYGLMGTNGEQSTERRFRTILILFDEGVLNSTASFLPSSTAPKSWRVSSFNFPSQSKSFHFIFFAFITDKNHSSLRFAWTDNFNRMS